jgi:hypothetical protein
MMPPSTRVIGLLLVFKDPRIGRINSASAPKKNDVRNPPDNDSIKFDATCRPCAS